MLSSSIEMRPLGNKNPPSPQKRLVKSEEPGRRYRTFWRKSKCVLTCFFPFMACSPTKVVLTQPFVSVKLFLTKQKSTHLNKEAEMIVEQPSSHYLLGQQTKARCHIIWLFCYRRLTASNGPGPHLPLPKLADDSPEPHSHSVSGRF